MASRGTTVKVSRDTLRELELLRDEMNLKSIDDALAILLKERRRKALSQLFGIDKGRITPFMHSERGEDR